MSSKIDLHIHSKYSPDADLSLEELIQNAEKVGMELISVTDHNVLEFHRELAEKNIETNVRIIPGIELDCCIEERNFHLLGYNIDISSTDFDKWQKEFTEREMDAVPERIAGLQKLGFDIDPEEVYNRSGGAIPQEELMAEIILENRENHKHPKLAPYLSGGYRSDMPLINFFWDFFAHGKPVYIPVKYLDLKDAISMIKDNGGVSVLAHPGANFRDNFNIIDQIVKHGVEGIEAISTYHSLELTKQFLTYAEDNNLIITCGSDFHGRNKPLVKIGNFDEFRYGKHIKSFFLD